MINTCKHFIYASKNLKGLNMELKKFVSESLTQIIDGVKDAQEKTEKSGARINPKFTPKVPEVMKYQHRIKEIDFDVAVTVQEESGIKSGAGVAFGPVVIGTRADAKSSDGSLSRIKFTVPVIYPEV